MEEEGEEEEEEEGFEKPMVLFFCAARLYGVKEINAKSAKPTKVREGGGE